MWKKNVEKKGASELPAQTKIGFVDAGGTIGSIVNCDGAREDGKGKINLLDRLKEQKTEIFESLQITITGTENPFTDCSENMLNSDREKIVASIIELLNNDATSVVVTHGTDSMEQTAKYLGEHEELQRNLRAVSGKVIITGANEDTSHPETDAWDNLAGALQDASRGNLGSGIYVSFHQRTILAQNVVKEPWNGKEMNFIDNTSEEYREMIVQYFEINKAAIERLQSAAESSLPDNEEFFSIYEVNRSRKNHEEFFKLIDEKSPRVVLLVLYHSGTANTVDSDSSVSALVSQLVQKRIVCLGVTETGEPVDLHAYKTSVDLREAGVVPLYNMTLPVAQAKLRLIDLSKSPVEIIQSMLKPIVDEISCPEKCRQDIEGLLQLYS